VHRTPETGNVRADGQKGTHNLRQAEGTYYYRTKHKKLQLFRVSSRQDSRNPAQVSTEENIYGMASETVGRKTFSVASLLQNVAKIYQLVVP
jgi:hypothetical protein